MTYCVGIKTNEGIVLASDSRTNAGLDNVNIYSKMLTYDVGDRTVIIVTSGNLGTSQAVFKSIEKDINDKNASISLNTCKDFEQIASYIGKLNTKHSSPDGINTDSLVLGSTFIVGGQILSLIAIIENMASMAPAAPKRCPVMDLVELTISC